MASANVGCCGGCFSGLGFGQKNRTSMLPDVTATTVEQALKLPRPNEGTWMPSPHSNWSRQRTGSADSSRGWATPGNVSGAAAVDFDMLIEEFQSPQSTVQLDTDGRAGRLYTVADGSPKPQTRSRFEAEQLVASPGRLPRPMTADQREDAIRSLLPTATYQMLSKIDPKILDASTEQSQTLRRKLARGSTIVFINAGTPGKRFTFERAAELGIKTVILEHPGSWSSSLVTEGCVAKFIPIDMSQDSEQVFKEALHQIKKLGEDGKTGGVDGIATFVELSVPLVARLSEALGLPGHRPAAVDAARNKHATRACLKNAGLPTPRNFLIQSPADIDKAAQGVGFPAVLKPVSGAASLGVKKVTSLHEMRSSYKEVVDELSSLVISSGALVKADGSKNSIDADQQIDLTVLMEQYLDGPEVDVDVVMSDGEWRYAGVADNGPTLEPYFNETWAVCPSLLPKEKQKLLKELSINSVKALGFTNGIFHVECKMTSTGPQLIEVNARMGGGQVHECNLRTWGVDLVEETLFTCLGIPCRPPLPKTPFTAAAYCYVNPKKSGTVTDISALEALLRREGVVWAKPMVRVGTKIVGPEEGLPTWLCDLFVTKPTAKEALDFLLGIEKEMPVKVA